MELADSRCFEYRLLEDGTQEIIREVQVLQVPVIDPDAEVRQLRPDAPLIGNHTRRQRSNQTLS